MPDIVFLIVISYLIGSIPTAIIAGKILKNIDIREHGSGNAGATNVFRVLGWKAGLIVLLIDMFKGFAPVWWLLAPQQSGPELQALHQILIGLAAVAGHIWTLFARFRGGKGVGTAAGVFLALQPLPVLGALVIFILIVAKTKYVSLGSTISATLLPVLMLLNRYVLGRYVPNLIIVVGVMLAVLIIIMHRENIKRLIAGTENKLSFSKEESK